MNTQSTVAGMDVASQYVIKCQGAKGFLAKFTGLLMALAALNAFADAAREAALREDLPKLQAIYHVAPCKALGPETPLSREYFRLLTRYVRYAQKNLRDWPAEPGAKFHKADTSHEHSVRQNATVAVAFAVLSAYGDFDEHEAHATRQQVEADTVALLRYLSVTHVANFLPTGDGKPWGDAWQSAYWAGFAGQAAWLVWDRLPDETKVLVARMVIHEANRFNTRPPDDGEWHDTKAEENAWNSEVIALARCMFPAHPNAALWHERAIVYMINSFSTRADHENATRIDGKRVQDWVTTTCIHPDFTAENHNRVHPDYLSTFSLNLRNAVLYKLAGLETPRATFHHAADCYRVWQHLTAANGGVFYINGQDWWPHSHYGSLEVGGLVNALLREPNAAFLERSTLAWMQRMHSRFDDGRLYDPREYNYPNAEEELMECYAKLYLLHRLCGDGPPPASAATFREAQSGVRLFETGGFVTHRTPDKFVSFAWVNGAMGLVYPAGDTWFTAPYERSLTGRITVIGAKDGPPKLQARNVVTLPVGRHKSPAGFAFVGRFARCEDKVEQQLAMISLPGAPVLYVERLRALVDVDVKEIATGILAVLNEDARPLTRNERTVWTTAGRQIMQGAVSRPAALHTWKTDWANLDDRVGVVARASGQMAYLENHAYQRARLQQELVANYLPDVGPRRAGEVIAESVVAILPNATHRREPSLRVERFGGSGVAVQFGGWLVAVNLGGTEISGQAFERSFEFAALGALVQTAKKPPRRAERGAQAAPPAGSDSGALGSARDRTARNQ